MDQRYFDRGTPKPLGELMETTVDGRFLLGNVPRGKHTLKITVDGGRSFVAERSFFVPVARSDAHGPTLEVVYDVPILVAPADPTPADCKYNEPR